MGCTARQPGTPPPSGDVASETNPNAVLRPTSTVTTARVPATSASPKEDVAYLDLLSEGGRCPPRSDERPTPCHGHAPSHSHAQVTATPQDLAPAAMAQGRRPTYPADSAPPPGCAEAPGYTLIVAEKR
jgi:hypothetical protein